eukprot:9206728-Ditylum_brightwellii.AAC.1
MDCGAGHGGTGQGWTGQGICGLEALLLITFSMLAASSQCAFDCGDVSNSCMRDVFAGLLPKAQKDDGQSCRDIHLLHSICVRSNSIALLLVASPIPVFCGSQSWGRGLYEECFNRITRQAWWVGVQTTPLL